MKTLEVLQGVDKLLSSEDKHCIGAYARNKEGVPVGATSNKAVCWCLIGAVRKVLLVPGDSEALKRTDYNKVIAYIRKHAPEHNMLLLNDRMGYAAVKKFVRKHIKELE